MITAASLLGEVQGQIIGLCPDFAFIPWTVEEDVAVGDLGDLLMKKSLVVDALPYVNALHAMGWKRRGYSWNPGIWKLTAYLRRGGAEVRLRGTTCQIPGNNGAVPYFAPNPPPLVRGKKALEDYRAWEAKCREDAW